jgi:hypothetical protein
MKSASKTLLGFPSEEKTMSLEDNFNKLEQKRKDAKEKGASVEITAGEGLKAIDDFIQAWGPGKYVMSDAASTLRIAAAKKLKELLTTAESFLNKECSDWEKAIKAFQKDDFDPVTKEIKKGGEKFKDVGKMFTKLVSEYLSTSETEVARLKATISAYIGMVGVAKYEFDIPVQHVNK